MYAYLSSHMVTSSLPYIGRFRLHALQLVLMACFPSLVLHYVPLEHFHSSTVHDQIRTYPTLTVFFIWLVEVVCITRVLLLIQGGKVTLVARRGCERGVPI